jgi:hypothetical protein
VALPASWTESSLIAALEAELEPVMTDLGLDALDVLTTAAGTDVPAVLGVSSVASVSYGSVADVVKVLVIGRWAAWQKAVDVASVRFDLKAGSADLKQSQQWTQLTARLESARAAALRYSEVQDALGGGNTAYVSSVGVAGSPYSWPYGTEWG